MRIVTRICLTILLLFSGGCSPAFYARCLDTAIYQTETFADKGYEVRIAYGKTSNGIAHVQAMAKVNGRWEWLVSSNLILTGRKHDFIVEENLSLMETKRRFKQNFRD